MSLKLSSGCEACTGCTHYLCHGCPCEMGGQVGVAKYLKQDAEAATAIANRLWSFALLR